MKVLLIAGGWSSEREISLAGATVMEKTLRDLGHKVTFFDLLEGFDNLVSTARRHDFAMLNLHGTPGEDGLVQAMLERAGCPYLGAGPASSFLALNKAVSKQLFREAGLPTADWEYLPVPPGADWSPRLTYPLFVKSNLGGSSIHLGRADTREELDALMDDIFSHGDSVLIEKELKGAELTCAILGDRVLPPILIQPTAGTYFDFTSKYQEGGAREICPAPIPEETTARVQELTRAACAAIGIEGYGRVDFILSETGELSILELNTLPGMTPTSLVPKEAKAVGMSFADLLAALIDLGVANAARRRN